MKVYYEDEWAVIYHASYKETIPLLSVVDHVITDPPYESEAHTLQRRVKRGGGIREVEPLSFAPMTEKDRDLIAVLLAGKVRRWVLVFCQVEAAMRWRDSFEAAKYVYKRTCIWVKPDGMPQYSGDRPGMGYESIVALHPIGRSGWNGGGRHGVFIVPKNDNNGQPAPHPTTKPHRLMQQLIGLFTDQGEIILDPFMGSGTTLLAAKQLRRKAIGIEIEEKYCEIAARRLMDCPEPLPYPEPVRKAEEANSLFG
jgi:DNA modification methylase